MTHLQPPVLFTSSLQGPAAFHSLAYHGTSTIYLLYSLSSVPANLSLTTRVVISINFVLCRVNISLSSISRPLTRPCFFEHSPFYKMCVCVCRYFDSMWQNCKTRILNILVRRWRAWKMITMSYWRTVSQSELRGTVNSEKLETINNSAAFQINRHGYYMLRFDYKTYYSRQRSY